MPNQINRKDLSLKGLELFRMTAENGSLQSVARETGLSVSTISHHLKSLEDTIGVELFNHARRPLVLTPTGQRFLRSVEGALLTIRKAKAEASAGNVTEASLLRIGSIEDIESDIIPELAVYLSSFMPKCDFTFQSDSSHTIIEMLRNRQLDLGIVTVPTDRPSDLNETPLLRDPFTVVLPKGQEDQLKEIFSGRSNLPLIRFPSNQFIARQIESQLRRTGHSFPTRFECSNSQTQMAMVASGVGWAITTPMLFSRSKRFQPKLQMHPFPGKSFARHLSIFSTPDCSEAIQAVVGEKMKNLVSTQVIQPMHKIVPWLQSSFALVE